MLASREFRFLHVATHAGETTPWSSKILPRLWVYHLNYCDFLNLDLARPCDRPLLESAASLMLDWTESNPAGSEIGWEPYPLSLRIVNWLKFLLRNAARLEAIGGQQELGKILDSLRRQCRSLERQLEFHLRANHLLKNAKALLFAGALLETADSARWWKTGIHLLESQLAEQILTDGGHFERSPMYHAQVLEDLLDLESLFSACHEPIPARAVLAETIAAMGHFLASILHPDGEIPLFSDSAFGMARPASELLRRVGSVVPITGNRDSGATFLADTGYGVLRDPTSSSCLVFDSGPLGPHVQPGHGHCDALSYELSLDGERVVVDTGTSTYEPGRERHYERSTAAHNTIRVDGLEQAEIWAAFRVGRRYKTAPIQSGEAGSFHFLHGAHDGYRKLNVIHSRQIIHGPGNTWIVVDHLAGKGTHRIESFVHFHPSVTIEACSPAASFFPGKWHKRLVIHSACRRYHFVSSPVGSFTLKQAWYSPEIGRRKNQLVGYWTWEGRLPVRLLYAFLPAGTALPPIRIVAGSNFLDIGGTQIPLS